MRDWATSGASGAWRLTPLTRPNKTYLASCQDNGCEYAMKRQLVATLNYKW